MKNKILLLGGLCLVLALGLVFIGCDSGGPVDHPDFDSIGLTVTRAGNGDPTGNANNLFLLEWSAVEGVGSYYVVSRPIDGVTYIQDNNYGFTANPTKYVLNTDKTDFIVDTTATADIDALYYRLDLQTLYPNNTVVQIGIYIQPLRKDRNPVFVWDATEWLLP